MDNFFLLLLKKHNQWVYLIKYNKIDEILLIHYQHKFYHLIHQGKYHQVKRMFLHYGLTVIKLEREKFAFLDVKDLSSGEYRLLNNDEINKLLKLV